MKGSTIVNQRFKIAFNQLIKHGAIVRNDPSKGYMEVAEKIFGHKAHWPLIISCLHGQYFLQKEEVERFCEAYGISKAFMFEGKLNKTNP